MQTLSHSKPPSFFIFLCEHSTARAVLNGLLCLLISAILWHTQIVKALVGAVPLTDFDAYYSLAQAALSGINPYQVEIMQTLGPPLVIAPFLPLSLLPLEWARATFTALSLLAAAWACWALAKPSTPKLRLTHALALFLFLLSFFPARFSLLMGQSNLLIMALMTGFLLSTQVVAGIVGSSILKTQYLLSGFSLLRHQKKTLFQAALVLFAIFLLTLPIFTPSAYQTFLSQTLTPLVTQTPEFHTTNYYNQTLMATTARLGFPSSSFIPVALLWILSAAYLTWSGDKRSAVVLSVLLAPVVWQHYFIVLFPVIVLSFEGARTILQLILLSLATILLSAEFPSLHTATPTLFVGIAASHFMLGGMLLLLFTLYQAKKECYTSSNGKSFDSYSPRSRS